MSDHADIGFLARHAYGLGIDPIDYAATHVVEIHVDAYLTIVTARHEDPASFPGYTLELSRAALARRIVGDLLDAGWVPPEVNSS